MPKFDVDNYVDVQERIVRFWSEYPEGAIRTRLMSLPDDFTQCRYEAAIYKQRDSPHPDATGYAFEIVGNVGANVSSHEENAETSAIGRALANMGYAKTREDRPSRQEMEKVNRMQPDALYGVSSPPPMRPAYGTGLAIASPVPKQPVAQWGAPPHAAITPRQWSYFADLASERQFTPQGILMEIASSYGLPPSTGWGQISKDQVVQAIDWMKSGARMSFGEWRGKRAASPTGQAPPIGAEADGDEAYHRSLVEGFIDSIAQAATPQELDQLYQEVVQAGVSGEPGMLDAFERATERLSTLWKS